MNKKEGIVIENNKIDLALYIIDLKIAQAIKNNKEIDYKEFNKKLMILKKEKEEIYKQNEEIIDKVLNVYKNEIE